MPTTAGHRGTTTAPQLGSWACIRRPAPPSIPLALLAHPPWGKPRVFLLSDLGSPGFEHGAQGMSTGTCPHGAERGKGHSALCRGEGTSSAVRWRWHWQHWEWCGTLWGLCGDRAGSAVHKAAPTVPSLCTVCTGDAQGWTCRGPMCFWIQLQQLLAQQGQMEAVLNSSSSAGCTDPYGPRLSWRGSPGGKQGSSAYLHSQSAHPGARPSADFVLSAAANDKEESRGR